MSEFIQFNFKDSTYVPPSGQITFNFIGTVFNILGGRSNNFVAIWADETATMETAVLYAASTGAGASLSVVDLASKVLKDFYTKTHTGAFNEKLDGEDIEDINIGSRG
jgi:hypothetical protein